MIFFWAYVRSTKKLIAINYSRIIFYKFQNYHQYCLLITVPSRDLEAAKASNNAVTHRISWNFIFCRKKKNDFTRFKCTQKKKRDQKYQRRIEEKDVVKIHQKMSKSGQINYANQCLNNISTKKKKSKCM